MCIRDSHDVLGQIVVLRTRDAPPHVARILRSGRADAFEPFLEVVLATGFHATGGHDRDTPVVVLFFRLLGHRNAAAFASAHALNVVARPRSSETVFVGSMRPIPRRSFTRSIIMSA